MTVYPAAAAPPRFYTQLDDIRSVIHVSPLQSPQFKRCRQCQCRDRRTGRCPVRPRPGTVAHSVARGRLSVSQRPGAARHQARAHFHGWNFHCICVSTKYLRRCLVFNFKAQFFSRCALCSSSQAELVKQAWLPRMHNVSF